MSEREPSGGGDVQLDPPPTGAFGSLDPADGGTIDLTAGATGSSGVLVTASRSSRRQRSLMGLLTVAWGPAWRWALISAGVALGLAEVVAWLGALAGASYASVATKLRAGGVLFLWFHDVGLSVSAPSGGFSGPGAAILQSVGATVWVAFLLGTLLVLWLLAMGGRRVAREAGGPGWLGALHGTKVALPYALVCVVVALLEQFSVVLPGGGLGLRAAAVPVAASIPAAFLFPLGLGAVGGFVGGLFENRDDDGEATRIVRGAVGGARAMLGFALALSFLGLLILALVHPDLTRRYTDGMFGGGAYRGIALLGINLLWLPNMTAWFLVPAMGSCVTANLSYGGSVYSSCIVSYGHVATPAALRGVETLGPFATNPAQAPPAPAADLAFLAIPLVAVVLGGWLAARRTAPATRAGAAGSGALAGVVFAAAVAVTSVLASVVLQIHGVRGVGGGGRPAGTATLWVGPAVGAGALFALAWGVLGGALGGLLAGPVKVSAEDAWRPAQDDRTGSGQPSESSEPPELPEPPDAAQAPIKPWEAPESPENG